jgi:hypothetical protein
LKSCQNNHRLASQHSYKFAVFTPIGRDLRLDKEKQPDDFWVLNQPNNAHDNVWISWS